MIRRLHIAFLVFALMSLACTDSNAPADTDLRLLVPEYRAIRTTEWTTSTVNGAYRFDHPSKVHFYDPYIPGAYYHRSYSYYPEGDSVLTNHLDWVSDTITIPFDTVRSWMFPTPYYHDYVEYYGVLNGKPAHYWQATFLPGIDSRRVAGVYYSNLIGDTLSLFVCTWSTDITYYDIARRALLSVEPSN